MAPLAAAGPLVEPVTDVVVLRDGSAADGCRPGGEGSDDKLVALTGLDLGVSVTARAVVVDDGKVGECEMAVRMGIVRDEDMELSVRTVDGEGVAAARVVVVVSSSSSVSMSSSSTSRSVGSSSLICSGGCCSAAINLPRLMRLASLRKVSIFIIGTAQLRT
jgi:hypothetical protein